MPQRAAVAPIMPGLPRADVSSSQQKQLFLLQLEAIPDHSPDNFFPFGNGRTSICCELSVKISLKFQKTMGVSRRRNRYEADRV